MRMHTALDYDYNPWPWSCRASHSEYHLGTSHLHTPQRRRRLLCPPSKGGRPPTSLPVRDLKRDVRQWILSLVNRESLPFSLPESGKPSVRHARWHYRLARVECCSCIVSFLPLISARGARQTLKAEDKRKRTVTTLVWSVDSLRWEATRAREYTTLD